MHRKETREWGTTNSNEDNLPYYRRSLPIGCCFMDLKRDWWNNNNKSNNKKIQIIIIMMMIIMIIKSDQNNNDNDDNRG